MACHFLWGMTWLTLLLFSFLRFAGAAERNPHLSAHLVWGRLPVWTVLVFVSFLGFFFLFFLKYLIAKEMCRETHKNEQMDRVWCINKHTTLNHNKNEGGNISAKSTTLKKMRLYLWFLPPARDSRKFNFSSTFFSTNFCPWLPPSDRRSLSTFGGREYPACLTWYRWGNWRLEPNKGTMHAYWTETVRPCVSRNNWLSDIWGKSSETSPGSLRFEVIGWNVPTRDL